MSSTFTVNKGIEMPAAGDYVNAWAPPVNADWEDIDNALGGTTSISVTGIAGPTIALTLSQYQPPNIQFTGVLSASLTYQIPTSVGGQWTIKNSVTGSGSLSISINAGNVLVLQPGRTLIVSNGSVLDIADSATVAGAQAYANTVANAAQAAAISTAEASAAATYVPLTRTVGLMTGVTIAADPGTTPSGAPGDLYLYY